MSSIIKRIYKENLKNDSGNLVRPPQWVSDSTQYETIMGSIAYGVSSDSSDTDIYGFCIPNKEIIFPHLTGHIDGFGISPQGFEQYQEHHINDPSAKKQYDIVIFSIVKYFQLCMTNNPNVIDSLFTPNNCVVNTTKIGSMVRDNRKIFLHKGCWHKFKGYAFSQLHKANIKNPQKDSKRYKDIQEKGYDVKYCYHVVRLINEVEQILIEGDLDLQRNREYLKAIRNGEVSFEEVKKWFTEKENYLEKIYAESSLRYSPDEPLIRQLLLNCLEEYYGSLDNIITNKDQATVALQEIANIIKKNSSLL